MPQLDYPENDDGKRDKIKEEKQLIGSFGMQRSKRTLQKNCDQAAGFEMWKKPISLPVWVFYLEGSGLR